MNTGNYLKITLFVFFFMPFFCSAQQDSGNEPIGYNIAFATKSYYRFPTDSLFKIRMQEVFGVNIDTYSEEQQVFHGFLRQNKNYKTLISRYGWYDESTWYPEVYMKEKYIYWPEPDLTNLSLLNLNKYVFYNDDEAFNNLRDENSGFLYYLLQDFGYEEPRLVDFIFNQVHSSIKEGNTDYLPFVFFGAKGVFGTWQLRKDLLENYCRKYPQPAFPYPEFIKTALAGANYYSHFTPQEGSRFTDTDYLAKKYLEGAAYLSEKLLEEKKPNELHAILRENPDFLEHLKKNNAHGNPLLNEYVKSK